MAPTLALGMACGITLDQLRSMARVFNAEWDRLADAVLSSPLVALPPVRLAPVVAAARTVQAMAVHCGVDNDNFLSHLRNLGLWADRVEAATDTAEQLDLLCGAANLKTTHGRSANWACDLDVLRESLRAVIADAGRVHAETLDGILRRLAYVIAEATVAGARERQSEGQLEFHDLLVLARELLRSPVHGADVRSHLQLRYQRLLLDEFQDTDPIQVELAVRIAGGAAASARDWTGVNVPDGRLFIVGDPKQSIYRFRRADITTYLTAQARIGEDIELTTNFRTTRPILEWINYVFGQLIVAADRMQPAYRALDPHREPAPGDTHVVALGIDPGPNGLKADDVRQLEAADVAEAIRTALADRWQVWKAPDGATEACWCDIALGDIAVLLPARTSLPYLETALDAAGIPYRAEASSLVYRTAEIRDLLLAVQALDDPTDALALVSTLRSPLFGCGDDDLWTWRRHGGSWNLLAAVPDAAPEDHPVWAGIAYLRELHDQRSWLAPSELLDRLVRDRRMLEVAGDGPRARDVWRRLRFVIDQARAWTEAERGGHRAYLSWVRHQADESARVAEAVLPETDTQAVRIMTIHAAKGLEFPMVIVSGLTSRPGGQRTSVEVLWPPHGGVEYKFGSAGRTPDFDAAKPIDEQMGHHERLRLLYVACTRARDHLIVSLHRTDGALPDPHKRSNAQLLAGASSDAPHMLPLHPAVARPAPASSANPDPGPPGLRRLAGRHHFRPAVFPVAVNDQRVQPGRAGVVDHGAGGACGRSGPGPGKRG